MSNRSLILLLSVCGLGAAQAQESANPALEDCIRQELRAASVKGAALGALGSLSIGLLGRKDDRKVEARQLTLGASAGGAMGLATRYFTAAGLCFERHPEWIPESQLDRGPGYEEARQAHGYRPEQGVLLKALALEMPERIAAGQILPIRARFVLFTPDGAELPLQIERRLYAIAEGRTQALRFPGHEREERRLPAGENQDLARLPVPKEVPSGVAYRCEWLVSVAGQPAITLSATVSVE